jgi:helix-turn-helix protein
MKAGLMTDSRVELLAISEFHNWTINYMEIDEDQKIIENLKFKGTDNSIEKVILVAFYKGKHFLQM